MHSNDPLAPYFSLVQTDDLVAPTFATECGINPSSDLGGDTRNLGGGGLEGEAGRQGVGGAIAVGVEIGETGELACKGAYGRDLSTQAGLGGAIAGLVEDLLRTGEGAGYVGISG